MQNSEESKYYEDAKKIFDTLKNKDSLSAWQIFLAGFVSGVVVGLGDEDVDEVVDVPVYNEDGSLKNFFLKVAGKSFRCNCGCNVFHQPDDKNLNKYKCNSCNVEFSTA